MSPKAIPSMPGAVQHTEDSLRGAVNDAAAAGVGESCCSLFPPSAMRRVPVPRSRRCAQRRRPRRSPRSVTPVIMADLCPDEFTPHGHCGVLTDDGSVDNDATLLRYEEMALSPRPELTSRYERNDGRSGRRRSIRR